MNTSSMTVKGQLVVPVRIRRKYNLKKGAKVAFIEQDGNFVVQPLDKDYFRRLAGILGTDGSMLKSLMEDKKRERDL